MPVPRPKAAPNIVPPDDDEVLPDKELNLDGMVPPPLVNLHNRLAKRSELLKLHLKHYRVSSAQFRRRTSELYISHFSFVSLFFFPLHSVLRAQACVRAWMLPRQGCTCGKKQSDFWGREFWFSHDKLREYCDASSHFTNAHRAGMASKCGPNPMFTGPGETCTSLTWLQPKNSRL